VQFFDAAAGDLIAEYVDEVVTETDLSVVTDAITATETVITTAITATETALDASIAAVLAAVADPEDIATAVWEYGIEAGYTAEELVRLMVGFLCGDATDLDTSTPIFLSLNGLKTRISGLAVVSGDRNATIGDLT
jgi:hypothetical protein